MKTEIIDAFDKFLYALEIDDNLKMSEYLTDNVTLESTMSGEIHDKSNVVSFLKWNGIKDTEKKIRVFNNTIYSNDDLARQSCFLVCLFSKDSNQFSNIFQTAIETSIKWKNQNKKWMIESIKAFMTCESGNSLIVSNWWKMIDYSKFYGADNHYINAYYDAPWSIEYLKLNKENEECIHDVFNRYCWDLDTGAFDDLLNIATDDFHCDFFNSNDPMTWKNSMENKWNRTIEVNGITIPRESCWNHICSFIELKIYENDAEAKILRFEPNRIGNRFIHKFNTNYIYYPYSWIITFKKINNTWKMSKESVANSKDGMEELSFRFEDRRYF